MPPLTVERLQRLESDRTGGAETMTRNTWHDLETYSETPIKNGTHAYAENAEVMIWAFADGDGDVKVWDVVNDSVHWQDELSGVWVEEPLLEGTVPWALMEIIDDPEALIWFHNGGQFDFPVLSHAMPYLLERIPMHRWRDTMVQAFSHSLPGALEKLGSALNISEDKRKLKEGKKLVQLFCKPQNDAFFEKHGTRRATKQTHPVEWQKFIEYAGGDITTMREAHRLMPTWNWRGKHIDLWHCDLRINMRGFAVDLELAEAAVKATETTKAELAKRTQELTEGQVQAATQRDQMLRYILEAHGVELPDMQSDTLERRMQDENLPDAVRELLGIRLLASMNSASKYKTLLKGVSRDGRLRGTMQFRGAGRTGRVAHRLSQPGNMRRPTLDPWEIEQCIEWLKLEYLDAIELSFAPLMEVLGNAVRGCIIAPPGRKLVVADLANIEGRMAAWLAGEEWKLDAFRAYDAGEGPDLYVLAYSKSFNVDPATVGKGPKRQIGKVQELMFQYGGGVGAWLTGAATYGIDLDQMSEQVWDTLPQWAKDEAESFMHWLYESAEKKYRKAIDDLKTEVLQGVNWPEFTSKPSEEQWKQHIADKKAGIESAFEAAKLKVRFGLSEKTFITCDAIKRLWRKAHPQISSYWTELEDAVKYCIANPNETLTCRKLKIRRSGAWLRICLPSGRELCYPGIGVETKGAKAGQIYYTGQDAYTKQWGKVYTYGGKLFENVVQAAAADQLVECLPIAESQAYDVVLTIHDEMVCDVPNDPAFSASGLAAVMTSDLEWNAGLPLAAAGFETDRYHKE